MFNTKPIPFNDQLPVVFNKEENNSYKPLVCNDFESWQKICPNCAMKNVTLLFPTIVELVDYENQLESNNYDIDREQLMMTGRFSDREIALAVNVYFAKVFQEE